MNFLGTQWTAELYGCDAATLDDVDRIAALMLRAAEIAGATIVDSRFHRFSPHGVSGVVVIAESHLAIHTWPEHGYAALDVFSCGATLLADAAFRFLADQLGATHVDAVRQRRGSTERIAALSRSPTPQRDVLSTVLFATGGVFEIPVLRRLVERRSAYQDIVVADTEAFGRCLVIDGIMQTASTDHQLYDDAILARLRPTDRDVLIVGGGDGYVARRARERAPEAQITVVDIDADVVEVADIWLNPGFRDDPRTVVHIGDGVAYARSLPPGSFDGVVLDLTDIPLDPARSADVTALYVQMLDAVRPLIRPGGWLSMQGGPSSVPPGEIDVAGIVAGLAAERLDDLVRRDVVLPSYGEGNAFFDGIPR